VARLYEGEPGTAWNFGPAEDGVRPVGWVVEQLRERWPGALEIRAAPPEAAAGESPTLRLDSSRARELLGWAPRWDLAAALDAAVSWYARYGEGAGMRVETLRQIEAYGRGQTTRRTSTPTARG
jgi:CDP-glucose 4,6-dehydratase